MLPAPPETTWVCSNGETSDYIQPYWDELECTFGIPSLCSTIAFNYIVINETKRVQNKEKAISITNMAKLLYNENEAKFRNVIIWEFLDSKY